MLSIIIVILGIIGFFFQVEWLFVLCGITCLIIDIMGIITGQLRASFLLMIVLYLPGFFLTDNFFSGLLLGAIISNSAEIWGILITPLFLIFSSRPEKKSLVKKQAKKNSPLIYWAFFIVILALFAFFLLKSY